MAKAKRLPSGNYRVLEYSHTEMIDGKKVRRYESFTDPDKYTAELMAAEFRADKKRKATGNLTYTEAMDKYISSKSNVLSPSTVRGYRVMQNYAFPLLLNEKIDKTNLIQRQFNENATKYGYKSLSNQKGFLSAVLKFSDVSVPTITIGVKKHNPIRVPTKKEAEQILKLIATAPEIECQILLAACCSLRQSEIAGIDVNDVDGDKIYIHGVIVPNEHSNPVYRNTTKTSASTRTIFMPQYLAQRINEACTAVGSGFLFSISPNALLRRFQKLLTKNGMYPFTVHAMRHYFAALLHSQNVPDKYIMALGGWSSDYVMKKVYQYAFVDELESITSTANRYFDNLI